MKNIPESAFPLPAGYNPHNGNCIYNEQYGMNLRDYFAAHALSAMSPWTSEKPSSLADAAYMLADAMMIRREQS